MATFLTFGMGNGFELKRRVTDLEAVEQANTQPTQHLRAGPIVVWIGFDFYVRCLLYTSRCV